MERSEILPPSLEAIPPLHEWPPSVKRLVLILAVILCCAAYLMMIGGAAGLVLVLLNWK